MSALMQRLRNAGHDDPNQRAPSSAPQPPVARRNSQSQKPEVSKDPNKPQKRLQLHQKCIYQRMMPGRAFISAHVSRLQHGYYENSGDVLHEQPMNGVSFVSVHFVFHPYDPRAHRFKSAEIKVTIRGDGCQPKNAHPQSGRQRPRRSNPRILKHAPELIYGAVSPENLQWNFSLSSSLGVSQAPLSATLNPNGGVRGSYKIYDMMSIQGSLRSLKSTVGSQYDVDDAQAVWTLEENLLQRSGLPREFDFVLLVHKPDDVKNIFLTVDVDAVVGTWFGDYPQWYSNMSKYLPTQDLTFDFDTNIGQRFVPAHPERGFNFADLPHPLQDYVTMPGTIYPTNDTADDSKSREDNGRAFDDYDDFDDDYHRRFDFNPRPYGRTIEASPNMADGPITPLRPYANPSQQTAPRRPSWAAEMLNVRVLLEHSDHQAASSRRYSISPMSYHEQPARKQSVRRKRSRSELKEYGAQQQNLHETAREALVNGDGGGVVRARGVKGKSSIAG
ncbi:unnamed protein product [Periconia digitata]|uniref:Uncharacterized protein n=1 Tax=Periconia digitata TaxID=1303443 RepID=A0A9W4U6J4_9PLEO|nr:unnamed protein product [Periconia digitata]